MQGATPQQMAFFAQHGLQSFADGYDPNNPTDRATVAAFQQQLARFNPQQQQQILAQMQAGANAVGLQREWPQLLNALMTPTTPVAATAPATPAPATAAATPAPTTASTTPPPAAASPSPEGSAREDAEADRGAAALASRLHVPTELTTRFDGQSDAAFTGRSGAVLNERVRDTRVGQAQEVLEEKLGLQTDRDGVNETQDQRQGFRTRRSLMAVEKVLEATGIIDRADGLLDARTLAALQDPAVQALLTQAFNNPRFDRAQLNLETTREVSPDILTVLAEVGSPGTAASTATQTGTATSQTGTGAAAVITPVSAASATTLTLTPQEQQALRAAGYNALADGFTPTDTNDAAELRRANRQLASATPEQRANTEAAIRLMGLDANRLTAILAQWNQQAQSVQAGAEVSPAGAGAAANPEATRSR
jgi:hypothetical protein